MLRPRALVLTLAAALALLATPARADVLVLKDGTRLEGTVVEERADEVVFEHAVGGAKVRSAFKKADLKSLERTFGGGGGPTPVGTEPGGRSPAPGDAYPEAASVDGRAMIVLDRSGSMSISGRFDAAVEEVEKILAALPEKVKFDVYLFHEKPVSLFDGDSLRPTESVRKKLRGWIDKVGGVDLGGRTDILSSLGPALERRPDALWLLSDGVPTRGEMRTSKIVEAAEALAKKHKVPIHVVAVRGGKYLFADVEDDAAAREGLKGIAAACGGKYREVEAAPNAEERTALKRDAAPLEDKVAFTLYAGGRKLVQRELTFPRFQVEVLDPALVRGPFVLEYSLDLQLVLRSRTEEGIAFEEIAVPLRYRKGTLWTAETIKGVRPNDSGDTRPSDPDDAGMRRLRIPQSGGSIEIVYRRGGREHKHVVLLHELR